MQKAMGVKTLEKSERREINCRPFSVIFGHFWGILAEIDFDEKGQLLAGI